MLEWILEFVGREDHSNTIYLTNQKTKKYYSCQIPDAGVPLSWQM
jgi:hypothetical protein